MMKLDLLRHLLGARRLLAAGMAAALGAAAGAAHAQAYVNATVGGQIAPGVYGRVDIGNGGPPALLYPQPVVIAPPALAVPRAPIYMYVPPGHAKHWSKHCARYAACGQPVYFVKERPRARGHFRDHDYDRYEGRRYKDKHHHERGHDDNRRGRGHGRHDR